MSLRILLAAFLVGSGWCVWVGASPPCLPTANEGTQRPTIFDPPNAMRTPWRGSASCAFSSCHGGDGPHGSLRSEYTSWIGHDKHVRAYDMLLTERSRIIEKNFRGKDAKPEQDAACLYCHSLDAREAQRGLTVATADGIGCERCHGPAAQWLGEHYTNAWQTLTPAEKEARGFHDLKDLVKRGRVCADCHIGSGDNDVNHDLVAAGHPRLNFELGSFVATMPPHWDVAREKQERPDLEARLWAVGQLISAEQALQLLAHRAAVAEKPWPEFAEYDCFACHHDLRADSPRQRRGYVGVPGALPWNTWYTALLPQAEAFLVSETVALDSLRAEMQKPYPDRAKVTSMARGLATRFGEQAGKAASGRADVALLRRTFGAVAREAKTLDASWDGAAQSYLALAALYHGLGDLDPNLRNAGVRAALSGMGGQLRFPRGHDSPRQYRPADFERWLQPLQSFEGR